MRETSWRWIPWLVGRSSTSQKGRIRSGRVTKRQAVWKEECCDNNVHAEQKDELGSGWTLKDSASGRSCTQSWEIAAVKAGSASSIGGSLKGYGLATRERRSVVEWQFPKMGGDEDQQGSSRGRRQGIMMTGGWFWRFCCRALFFGFNSLFLSDFGEGS